MCGFTLPEKSWQSNGRQTDRMCLKKPGEINQGVFHRCALSVRASIFFFSFFFPRFCVGLCETPLTTSGPRLCDTRPAGAAAAELCPSRSEGNWVVFLLGIYSQRRKYTETRAADGSINTARISLVQPWSTEEETAILSFHLFTHSSIHMST